MSNEQTNRKPRDWSQVNRSPHAVVKVWMSPEQRAYVERQAEAAGVSMSEYMRAAAMAVEPIKRRPQPNINRTLCGQILAELGKIGSNVNQIARALNQLATLTLEDFKIMRSVDRQLSEMRNALMEALGREP